ncbi:MAG: hypothetical protein FWH22_02955 [Fibromonadales bacterium]|nr:hypothetical protein [Fibromonadales bacterium]
MKNRFTKTFVAIAFVVSMAWANVWDGTVDTDWYNGTDTEFTISTAEQLAGLAVNSSISKLEERVR